MRRNKESGQAILMTVVALAILLLGALGLALDGAQLYAHRQMAQAAADAAAQGGVMSIFTRTYNLSGNPAGFDPSAPFTCGTADARTPCAYAASNGFGQTAGDQVAVSFPTSVPGVTLSPDYSPAAVKATVRRAVPATFLRLFGSAATTVRATATAVITQTISPVPILVLHPDLPAALHMGGSGVVRICGGPQKSIQVNSRSQGAVGVVGGGGGSGNVVVDLSRAGPNDTLGTCLGTGGDLGVFGGPTAAGSWLVLGPDGEYLQPEPIVPDPLIDVPEPALADVLATYGTPAPAPTSAHGCTAVAPVQCVLYQPGYYPGGINVGANRVGIFAPGVYYLDGNGGFRTTANGAMQMCAGCGADAVTGSGMVVYNHGTGAFEIGAGGNVSLLGAPMGSVYLGILFFQARNSVPHTGAQSHKLGGGGCLSLEGTIYLRNLVMTSTVYQNLWLSGSSCSSTLLKGEIIVSTLDLRGGGNITMQLDPNYVLPINQVALAQ